MNMLKTFFRTLVKSSSDPTYGKDVVKAPAWFSWKYFLVFTALTAVVTAARIMIPLSLFDASGAIRSVSEVYPADLRITGDQNGLNINQELPYSVSWPQNLLDNQEVQEEIAAEDIPMNIVTFTRDELVNGVDDVKAYDSFAVVTESTIYFKEDMDTGELRVYEVPEFTEPFTIDKVVVDNLVTSFAENPVIKQRLYIPLIGLGLLLFLYPLMLLGRLLTLAFFSLIAWVIVMIFMKGKDLGYSKIFQLSLHTVTPVVIVAYVLDAFGYTFFHGFLYFVTFMAWTLVMISRLGRSSVAAVAPESTPTVTRQARATSTRKKSTSKARKK